MTTTLPEITTDLFIDGSPVAASATLRVSDPAGGGAAAGHAASATAAQAADAVAAADRPVTAEILSRENGKILAESVIDSIVFEHRSRLAVGLASEVDDSAELAGPPYRTRVGHVPLGVVTIIVPFNWPLAILGASLAYALVAGNTVVVKPPPTAPLATSRTVALVASALPPGVLNVVTGADAEIGEVLVADPRARKVCFTGSVGGGKRIMAMAAANLTRVTLELGGNDPAIILPDAELTPEASQSLFHGP